MGATAWKLKPRPSGKEVFGEMVQTDSGGDTAHTRTH